MNLKDKRGDAPMLLIFIVALGLIALELGLFISFESRFEDPLREGEVVAKTLNVIEKVVREHAEGTFKEGVKECVGCSAEEIKEKFKEEIRKNELMLKNTNFYTLVRQEKYFVNQENGNYSLSMENVFVKSETEAGSAKRTFTLKVYV